MSIADLVLTNKLVVYDLENMTIGWADYNCEYPFIYMLNLQRLFPCFF